VEGVARFRAAVKLRGRGLSGAAALCRFVPHIAFEAQRLRVVLPVSCSVCVL
jgi:hypothetical protein